MRVTRKKDSTSIIYITDLADYEKYGPGVNSSLTQTYFLFFRF
jgi:hypothetical protein